MIKAKIIEKRECINVGVNQASIVVYVPAMDEIDEENSTFSAGVSFSFPG